jgi:hypothetical protein
MFRLITIAGVVAMMTVGGDPAAAQTVCGDREKMIHHLGDGYKESRSGIGLAANGSVVELFTAETGSWTMLATVPGGPTCVMGSGEGWEPQQTPTAALGTVS